MNYVYLRQKPHTKFKPKTIEADLNFVSRSQGRDEVAPDELALPWVKPKSLVPVLTIYVCEQ